MADDWNTDRPGRIPVLIATVGLFSLSVLGMLASPDTPAIIGMLVSGVLAIAVYHRHNWARWVVLVLIVLSILYVAYFILKTPMPLEFIYVLAAFALIYVLCVALLFVPSWGGKYFEPGPGKNGNG